MQLNSLLFVWLTDRAVCIINEAVSLDRAVALRSNKNALLSRCAAASYCWTFGVNSPVRTAENTAVGIRCANQATPSIRQGWH
jgi:hypothetical protein